MMIREYISKIAIVLVASGALELRTWVSVWSSSSRRVVPSLGGARRDVGEHRADAHGLRRVVVGSDD